MADDSMALLDAVRKAVADGDVDVLREGVRVLAEAIVDCDREACEQLPSLRPEEVDTGTGWLNAISVGWIRFLKEPSP